ncbi:MAG: phosphoserine phosphatase [Methanosarcinaceae archaeon]|nr:phosphoserine phosphatase [Methanosarcinaceae archaeon]
MNDPSTMNERELKNRINDFRTQISQNERVLKSIFNELKLQRTNVDELKEKRNELNLKVKLLVQEARELKEKRDAANDKIEVLKAKRSNIQTENNKAVNEIAQLKTERDNLNKFSRGNLGSLLKTYADELDSFLNAEIPLKVEIDIFERLIELEERIAAASSANDVHNKILEAYETSKNIHNDADEINKQIRTLAQESQKYHLSMLDIYKTNDECRKEANLCHSQIKDKYATFGPLRNKIDPLKAKTAQLREELSVHLEKLNDIQLIKDEKKIDSQHTVAKEKLRKKGRLSLEELGVLMDKGDLKF